MHAACPAHDGWFSGQLTDIPECKQVGLPAQIFYCWKKQAAMCRQGVR